MDLSALPEAVRLLVLNQVAAANVVAAESDLLQPFDFSRAKRHCAPSVWTEDELDALDREGVVVRDGFLGSGEETAAALAELRGLRDGGAMKQAGMVADGGTHVRSEVRGDLHMWLHDTGPALARLLERMEAGRRDLESVFETRFGGTQSQATCYPGSRARYARHLDASKGHAPTRLLTMVWYAAPCSGGELRLFLRDGTQRDVVPAADRLVLFQARLLEHAVLPCDSDRFALSTWLCE
jgi:SM-20-related protein